jgi:DNA polymerase IV
MSDRIILHCDLNNFYASVECLHHPEYRSHPLAVGGDVEKRHGIILAKNQLAKHFGIQTGEALWQARAKCPNLLIVKPNFSLYLRFSKLIKTMYAEYTDQIESFGIDEAWLDVTHTLHLFKCSPGQLADQIRERIKNEFGITASIGVSFNKVFAKLGSDLKKPDATTLITRQNLETLIYPLPISDLLYVGRATTHKLKEIGIYTIGDCAQYDLAILKRKLGKWGEYIWRFANGLDNSLVSKRDHEPMVKSIGNSTTSPKDLKTLEDVKIVAYILSESVAARLKEAHLLASTISIGVRDQNLEGFTRQIQLETPSALSDDIAKAALDLFEKNVDFSISLRSIGIKASQLIHEESLTQNSLFTPYETLQKNLSLEKTIEHIRERYGFSSIQRCLMLSDPLLSGFNPKQDHVIFPEAYFKG